MINETCGQAHQLNTVPNGIGVKRKMLGLKISTVTLGLASLVILLSGCSPLKVNQPTLLGRLSAKIKPPAEHSQSNTGNDGPSGTSPVGNGLNADNPENGSKQATSTRNPSERNQHTFNDGNSNANPSSSIEQGPFAVENRSAEEIERIRNQAYDQGRYDAIQASYQQQSEPRNYTNPSPYQNNPSPQWPGQPTQQMAPHLTMPQLNAPVQGYSGQPHPQLPNQPGSEFIDAPTDSVYSGQASPGQVSQRGLASQQGDVPQTPIGGTSNQFSNQNNLDVSLRRVEPAPILTQNPPRQESHNVLRAPGVQSYPAPGSTGHFMRGLNLIGSELRPESRTATEIARELQFRNEQLIEKLRDKDRENDSLLSKIDMLVQKMEAHAQTLESTQELLTKSNRLASLLREKNAKQDVSIQDLEVEKIRIETNADKALKEIEAELNRVLATTESKVD